MCVPALARSRPPAIRPEGKNNRLFVFSISMASVAQWSLDVAADSQDDLQDWVKKIREVAQTADARVSTSWSPRGAGGQCGGLSGGPAPAPPLQAGTQRKQTCRRQCATVRMR